MYPGDDGNWKQLISKTGKLCQDGDEPVNLDKDCNFKLSDCSDASGRMLPQTIDAFGKMADTPDSFKLSSQKNPICSGPAYFPSTLDVSTMV
jgi:hypothetical protein